MAGAFAAHVATCETAKFGLDKWHEGMGSGVIAGLPSGK